MFAAVVSDEKVTMQKPKKQNLQLSNKIGDTDQLETQDFVGRKYQLCL